MLKKLFDNIIIYIFLGSRTPVYIVFVILGLLFVILVLVVFTVNKNVQSNSAMVRSDSSLESFFPKNFDVNSIERVWFCK